MEKLKALLASRKFWAAVVGLALVILKSYKPDFPLSESEVSNLVYVLIAYILGTAIEDSGFSLSTSGGRVQGGGTTQGGGNQPPTEGG